MDCLEFLWLHIGPASIQHSLYHGRIIQHTGERCHSFILAGSAQCNFDSPTATHALAGNKSARWIFCQIEPAGAQNGQFICHIGEIAGTADCIAVKAAVSFRHDNDKIVLFGVVFDFGKAAPLCAVTGKTVQQIQHPRFPFHNWCNIVGGIRKYHTKRCRFLQIRGIKFS